MAPRLHLIIHGKVQGVFFRAWTQQQAQQLGLHGWVRNLPDGGVEVLTEGSNEALEKLHEACHRGPPAAQVSRVESNWEESAESFSRFEILR